MGGTLHESKGVVNGGNSPTRGAYKESQKCCFNRYISFCMLLQRVHIMLKRIVATSFIITDSIEKMSSRDGWTF